MASLDRDNSPGHGPGSIDFHMLGSVEAAWTGGASASAASNISC
jgi:hypothetical protein